MEVPIAEVIDLTISPPERRDSRQLVGLNEGPAERNETTYPPDHRSGSQSKKCHRFSHVQYIEKSVQKSWKGVQGY